MERNKLQTLHELLKELAGELKPDGYYTNDITRAQRLCKTMVAVEDGKQLLRYMEREWEASAESDEQLQEFYNMKFIVSFGHKTVEIPNNADTYEAVERLVKDFIKDYTGY